jgi:uncharacterized protein (TIGR03790 family)
VTLGVTLTPLPAHGGHSPDTSVVERVVILANSTAPESLVVARHYAATRGVPAANIVALPMSAAETTTWPEFLGTVWQPLLDQLVRDRWIDAIPMDLTDALGRRKYAVNGHRIAAMVVCRGVPLRIASDPQLFSEVPPYTSHSEFRTNAGAVDAELALLPMPNHPITAFVPNPLFQVQHPTAQEEQQVIKISRLDGPTVEDANALVDRAVAAEQSGLLGRAYVDLSDRDEIGNGWLNDTASQLKTLGFDTDVDRSPALLPLGARSDAPVLYFGWYNENLGGAFSLPGFRFPPGAIALHIHSYSATTLHSNSVGWAGPLVGRGVTATVGNVYEPYLQLTHRPHLLLRSLARGACFVDAGYFALQALSWQEVLIGDPLYRPFAVSLEQQLSHVAELPEGVASYATVRRVNLLEAAHRDPEALDVLREAMRQRPSLPLAVALAKRLLAAGDPAGAAGAFTSVVPRTYFPPDQWALAAEAARLCLAARQPARAVELWRSLVSIAQLPVQLREGWLLEAADAARAAQNETQAHAWDAERETLTMIPAGS